METAITVEAEEFEAVVRTYRQRIFRFALSSLRDRDAAESVTQDCLFRAYKAWPKFRGDASVLTWIMQIAVNLVRDASNNRRFRFWKMRAVNIDSVSEWISDPGTSPEERVRAKEQVEAICRICNRLSERQRTVFLLHFMEDMDASQN